MSVVSVVVPAYNAQAYLADALESVRAQSFTDWEIVVVDDGSQDNTAAVARRFVDRDPRIQLIRQENAGTPVARNNGYEALSKESEFLLFLDSDDVLVPHALEKLLDAQRTDPAAQAVFGMASYIDQSGQSIDLTSSGGPDAVYWTYRNGRAFTANWGQQVSYPVTYRELLYGSCIRTPGLALLPRATFERVGLYDPTIPGIEDWDLWIRVGLVGYLRGIPETILKYRIHGGNQSSKRSRMEKFELRMRRKLLISPDLAVEQRAAAIESLEFHHLRPNRLPLVRSARGMVDRLLSSPPASKQSLEASEGADMERRDLVLLVALNCNECLFRKVADCEAGIDPKLSQDEKVLLQEGVKKLSREEFWLSGRQAIRRLRQITRGQPAN